MRTQGRHDLVPLARNGEIFGELNIEFEVWSWLGHSARLSGIGFSNKHTSKGETAFTRVYASNWHVASVSIA